MTDQEIIEVAAELSAKSLNLTRVCGFGESHTLMEDAGLIELARALLSRAIPEGHVVVPGWLPIESAPKDRSVMLYTKYGLTYCGRYRQGQLGEPSQHLVEWRCDSSGRYANPTHWMPLPAAPANKEG